MQIENAEVLAADRALCFMANKVADFDALMPSYMADLARSVDSVIARETIESLSAMEEQLKAFHAWTVEKIRRLATLGNASDAATAPDTASPTALATTSDEATVLETANSATDLPEVDDEFNMLTT